MFAFVDTPAFPDSSRSFSAESNLNRFALAIPVRFADFLSLLVAMMFSLSFPILFSIVFLPFTNLRALSRKFFCSDVTPLVLYVRVGHSG